MVSSNNAVATSLAYPALIWRVKSVPLRLLPFFICLFGLWIGALPVLAATWQEDRDAGFHAFSNADYGVAVDHLQKAVGAAEKEGASAEQRGQILKVLTTIYYAMGSFRPAQDTISEWDAILKASVGETWEPQQRLDRDRLAAMVSEVLGQREPATEMGEDKPEQANEVPAPEGNGGPPLQTNEESLVKSGQAGEEPPSASSSNYAIHLESLKDKTLVDQSWDILKESYPDLLGDKSLEVTEIELGEQGTFYRIHAGYFATSAEAKATCEKFRLLDHYCKVMGLD